MMSKFTPARPVQNMRNGLHLLRNRKTLWQMVRDTLGGRYSMSFLTVVIVFVSLAYIIFPFDLIPDWIPVVGWIDDSLVLYLLLRRLVKETQRYNRHKAMERRG